jgi:cupin 2 domain-containing protein
MKTGNIFDPVEGSGKDEIIVALLGSTGFRLEQIVSNGQASNPDFWYDQECNEWVLLARGEAVLEFEQERLSLKAGDYLLIPAHTRHRVTSCSQNAVWLALHCDCA